MDATIAGFLEQIKVGAKQTHENMTLYCLLAAEDTHQDFLSLDEALDQGALTITEVDPAGRVSELKVRNKSDRNILMLEGEELVGAKQNRVLNITVLIAARSETIIPVSCIEQGRWSYRSREFGSAGRAMSADLKKKMLRSVGRNLAAFGSFSSGQAMLWQEIGAKFRRMSADPSPTMALSDLFDSFEGSVRDYLKAFRPVENQVGMIVFIDGEIAGVDLLAKFDAFRKIHPKLVHSYVMDALEKSGASAEGRTKPSRAKASKILKSAANASVEKRNSVALGLDLRLESDDVIGTGLEFDGQVIRLSLFEQSE